MHKSDFCVTRINLSAHLDPTYARFTVDCLAGVQIWPRVSVNISKTAGKPDVTLFLCHAFVHTIIDQNFIANSAASIGTETLVITAAVAPSSTLHMGGASGHQDQDG